MNRVRKPIFIKKLKIEKYAAKGKALGYDKGKIVFIKNTVPGDVVTARVVKKKKSYLEATPIIFHQYSFNRTSPFCSHFGVCGGCNWQHLSYEKQLVYKRQEVIDNLTKIGKIGIPEVEKTIPSEQIKFYRNKLEFTFSENRWLLAHEMGGITKPEPALGFYIPGRFDKVLDIEKCYLQSEPSNSIRLLIKEYAINQKLSFYDNKHQQGYLRNLIIRTSSLGEVMVIISFAFDCQAKREKLFKFLTKKLPDIDSWMYVINDKRNDTINDLKIELVKGKNHITERIGNTIYKIGPKSFFQTNTVQTEKMYKKIVKYAAVKEDDIIYDLYTGIGSIACYIAPFAKKIIGVEDIPEAAGFAKENAVLNRLSNTRFFIGKTEKILSTSFFHKYGAPDTIIIDPPRAGIHKKVIEILIHIEAPKIIYVSCNTATQARDIELLKACYVLVKSQPIDMFPHTHHIENIALLKHVTA